MTNTQEIQKRFFQQIREQLPAHLSLVDEISDLLGISADSTYRRLRGEKQLTLDELVILSEYFHISLDIFLNSPKQSIPFSQIKVDADTFQVERYLQFALERAQTLAAHDDSEMLMIVNDMTIFQLLQFPELAAFKLFFWQKSGLNFPSLKRSRFSLDAIDENLLKIGKAVVKEYVKVPSVEILGVEAINSFLRQINYYLELGFFENPRDSLTICDKIIELIRHFYQEADLGFKFPYQTKPVGKAGTFTLYYNELFVIDGLVLNRLGSSYSTFIATGPLNLVETSNPDFYHSKYEWAQNLMGRCILLSGVSEKERNKYFTQMEDRVVEFKQKIEKHVFHTL